MMHCMHCYCAASCCVNAASRLKPPTLFTLHLAIADMYESYRERECWDVVKAPPQGTVLNIVRAANSDRYGQGLHASLHTGYILRCYNVVHSCLSPSVSHMCHLDCFTLHMLAIHVASCNCMSMQHSQTKGSQH